MSAFIDVVNARLNRIHFKSGDLLVVSLVALIIGVFLTPVTFMAMFNLDQITHLQFARVLYDTQILPTPHFLYQINVILFYQITGSTNWLVGVFFASLVPQIVLSVILYVALRFTLGDLQWFKDKVWRVRIICAFFALALTIICAPYPLTGISALFWSHPISISPMLTGMITPAVYHNPTIITMRPIALVLFLVVATLVISAYERRLSLLGRVVAISLTAVLTILCGLSKPNYLIVLLPALGLWVLKCWIFRQPVGWRTAIFGIAIPGGLFLLWQFYYIYITTPPTVVESSIIFAPFATINQLTAPSRGGILILFLVSIIFPLSTYLFWWRHALRDQFLNFTWLTLLFGIAYMYLLAESGPRLRDGNFVWSAYISIFILNVVSLRFAMKMSVDNGSPRLNWRIALFAALFLFHVYSGVLFTTFYQESISIALAQQ